MLFVQLEHQERNILAKKGQKRVILVCDLVYLFTWIKLYYYYKLWFCYVICCYLQWNRFTNNGLLTWMVVTVTFFWYAISQYFHTWFWKNYTLHCALHSVRVKGRVSVALQLDNYKSSLCFRSFYFCAFLSFYNSWFTLGKWFQVFLSNTSRLIVNM